MSAAALKAETKDIVMDEVLPHAPETVWKVLTSAQLIARWLMPPTGFEAVEGNIFTYQTKPGGHWDGVIQCRVLEVVPNRRLIWTGALLPGYRPANPSPDVPFFFTAIIEIEPHGAGAKYTATDLHSTGEGRSKHEAMGFHQGWGAALDQLVMLAKSW